jgi:hypothetical protein
METIVIWITDFTLLATCPTVATDFSLPATDCHMSNNSKAIVVIVVVLFLGCLALIRTWTGCHMYNNITFQGGVGTNYIAM